MYSLFRQDQDGQEAARPEWIDPKLAESANTVPAREPEQPIGEVGGGDGQRR